MPSPPSHPLPPLTDLPPPRELPREETHLVPPSEIIAESKRALTGRLLRIFWAPGLVLLGLWYVLLILYVTGASPTFWFLSGLAALGDPMILRSAMSSLGFSSSGLWTAFGLLPVAATALSLALVPLAPSAIAGMDPRRYLSEAGFQREIATRLTAVLMIPPVLVVAALPLSVALGLPQPWNGLGAGPLMALSLGLGAILLGWVLVRRTVSAPRVLDLDTAEAVELAGRLGRDLDERSAAAQRALAQDRRHLPPSPGTSAASAALTPRGALLALAHIARASLTWVAPAAAGLGWLVFGITDLVTTFSGITQSDLTQVSAPLQWQLVALGAPMAVLVAFGVSLAPGLAILAAQNQRRLVIDQRTYASWAHRARVNPWEARVVSLTGWFSAGLALLGLTATAVLLALLGAATPVAWAGIVAGALVLTPLLGAGASAAMKSGLRDVLYGPAGTYMRRRTPYALVAPDIGTRAQRAKDPAVRAALRQRLQAEGGDHTWEIFDLDAAGEQLWVDDDEPGARDTVVRAADLAQGRLPDFGGDGSALTGGGDGPRGEYRSEDLPGRHEIPDSVTGLRKR
ncbi:hypothetical protein BH708_10910 [Brachybacterium sp. P6-10-X1]|uniref:hypothetical protein n=1 Tax=Brachybacterium sp. P6-10-X1 TaxID=1903186 RepID=UPI00097176AE|nr:hypothetical protein [Brachybacterium sp. P6-10-X1]APX33134.1 hypothetical protein BH708_10910 [Brachybacterium sp. P6-10-X1]